MSPFPTPHFKMPFGKRVSLNMYSCSMVTGQVFPVDKKPHQRSKKPLRRIDIREVRNKSEPGSVGSGGDFLIKESSQKPKSTMSKRIEIEEIETSKIDSDQESSTIRINSRFFFCAFPAINLNRFLTF